ncbi:MAG: hypothetical protein Q7P63_04825 [Verrucomicrobiota bacterium JB022]|nr:hypothetical protein [Verrucomicrobiota bacterium JB022]
MAANDERVKRWPWREVLLTALVAAVGLLVGLGRTWPLNGPILATGDGGTWEHYRWLFAQLLDWWPFPHLEYGGDLAFYPYGTSQVFTSWTFEQLYLTTALERLFGPGPWIDVYYIGSQLATALGLYWILRRVYGRGWGALAACVVAGANFYLLAKFPGHFNLSHAHWAYFTVASLHLLMHRLVAFERLSLGLVLWMVLCGICCLGMELGYVAGFAYTFTLCHIAVFLVWWLCHLRPVNTYLWTQLKGWQAELKSWRVWALGAAILLAAYLYLPQIYWLWRELAQFPSAEMPHGLSFTHPMRMLLPIVPDFTPEMAMNTSFFQDRMETPFAWQPGLSLFVLGMVGFFLAADRRRSVWIGLPLLCCLLIYALLQSSFHPFNWLPWMEHMRMAARFSLMLPLLFVLAWLPQAARIWRTRSGQVFYGLLGLLFLLELSTAWRFLWGTRYVEQPPTPEFVHLMETIRESPGEAVLYWPFCVAGGNGVGTGEFGPYYHPQAGMESTQVFHEKKMMSRYFGRIHWDQLEPLYRAGWDRMFMPDSEELFTAQGQGRDFDAAQWAFMTDFLRLNDFCGVLVFASMLPPETVEGFRARMGEPVAEAVVYGEHALFFRKPEAWQAGEDPVAGRALSLDDYEQAEESAPRDF